MHAAEIQKIILKKFLIFFLQESRTRFFDHHLPSMASYQALSPCASLAANPILSSRFFCHSQGRAGYESPEMERTEGMKASFWQEDAWSTGGDDFFVDDLLDLSKEDDFVVVERREEDEEEGDSFAPENQDGQTDSGSDGSSVVGFVGAVPGHELAVPADELADLEWLSHFVEDSFSIGTGSLQYSPGTGEQTAKKPSFPIQARVPVRPRTKRNRTARVWSPRDGFRGTSPSSSSTNTTTSLCADPVRDVPVKRRGRKPNRVGKAPEGARRCSHCLTQKTPQWRAGPLGSKTLCNACGVRYKSGRLVPEYRPAGSPTFVSDVHSNSHRKVLEMRRKKEIMMATMATSMTENGLPAIETC